MSDVRILAFAYSCEPGKGSELGAGWVWTRMLARLGEVWVLTVPDGREAIEASLPKIPERDRIHFIYLDIPPGSRFWWQKDQRGIRFHYLLWQGLAFRKARRLHKQLEFDLVWHLTMSTVWLGSLLGAVPAPFVYGPVGGGVSPPLRFLPSFGLRGALYELLRELVRKIGRYANPLARLAWRRARLILVQNPETQRWLPKRHRHKACVFPNVVIQELPTSEVRKTITAPTALFAGRLLPWKGAELAVRAIALRPTWHLLICGSGPQESELRRLTNRLGVTDRIRFLGWVARDDLLRVMREEAEVLLFPSLHDEAGWAVAEALVNGLPVICLDVGGPRLLKGDAGVAVAIDGDAPDIVARLATEGLDRVQSFGSTAEVARDLLLPARLRMLQELLSESTDLLGTNVGAKISAAIDRPTG